MSNYILIAVIIAYLAFLFFVAFWAEKNTKSKWVNNPYIYVLSLAVYCSAWTYYGSVGVASKSGIDFLAIYLGPVIAAPLWILILRKCIKLAKQHKVSSIADFISLRYGNNRFLGALVTLVCVFGVVPYISLQLKAISETFEILTGNSFYHATSVLSDSTFYIALLLAVFVAFFGTRATDASQLRKGIITTVAVESVLKLGFFLAIGVYVTFYLFDGTTDIYEQAKLLPNFEKTTSFSSLDNGFNWLFTIGLSFSAIFLLPRQFQVAVVENDRERYLKKAIWLFPLYLLLFNVFVIFIAWAGNLSLPDSVNHDYYTLLLPMEEGNTILALVVFLGGFSAVVSMIIVSTLALSTMVSNNLVIPYGFLDRLSKGDPEKNATYIKNIRRISIFSLIISAYLFYVDFSYELSLFSIGLISFVVIAQLAPAFFIGLFWNRGTGRAAIVGIILGVLVVGYTLVFPFTLSVLNGNTTFMEKGLFGIAALRPYQLFGIDFLSPEAHAFFWSMCVNTFSFLVVSVQSRVSYRERNYAELFVNSGTLSSLQEGAFVWKGEAYVSDIREVLVRFLGEQRTSRALKLFNLKYNITEASDTADPRLINFSERLLTGSIGSASAKILIGSVSKEKPVSLPQVLKILEESKKTLANNKLLKEQQIELEKRAVALREANEELQVQDQLKDEFLDTVSHELKTPVTAIRAASEVLLDDEMPIDLRKQFLQNITADTQRLETLIHNILDLEKLTHGRDEIVFEHLNIADTIEKAVAGVLPLADKKNSEVIFKKSEDIWIACDDDRIQQVLTNILSNALKFVPEERGSVVIETRNGEKDVAVSITDNGKGIPAEDMNYIFEKFYQSKNQNIKKPEGSGFGLAICKQIIERHGGRIWADETHKNGARFVFTIPKK